MKSPKRIRAADRLSHAKAAVLISILAAPSTSLASAIWDNYPVLTCRYDKGQFCDRTMVSCSPEEGRAVSTFNFKAKTMTALSFVKERSLTSFYYVSGLGVEPDMSSVFSEGSLYTFNGAKSSELAEVKPAIDGLEQSATDREAVAFHMTCYPG